MWNERPDVYNKGIKMRWKNLKAILNGDYEYGIDEKLDRYISLYDIDDNQM